MNIYFAGAIRGGRERVNDFAKIVMNCNKNCMDCGYCKQVMEDATITLDSTGLENY